MKRVFHTQDHCPKWRTNHSLPTQMHCLPTGEQTNFPDRCSNRLPNNEQSIQEHGSHLNGQANIPARCLVSDGSTNFCDPRRSHMAGDAQRFAEMSGMSTTIGILNCAMQSAGSDSLNHHNQHSIATAGLHDSGSQSVVAMDTSTLPGGITNVRSSSSAFSPVFSQMLSSNQWKQNASAWKQNNFMHEQLPSNHHHAHSSWQQLPREQNEGSAGPSNVVISSSDERGASCDIVISSDEDYDEDIYKDMPGLIKLSSISEYYSPGDNELPADSGSHHLISQDHSIRKLPNDINSLGRNSGTGTYLDRIYDVISNELTEEHGSDRSSSPVLSGKQPKSRPLEKVDSPPVDDSMLAAPFASFNKEKINFMNRKRSNLPREHSRSVDGVIDQQITPDKVHTAPQETRQTVQDGRLSHHRADGSDLYQLGYANQLLPSQKYKQNNDCLMHEQNQGFSLVDNECQTAQFNNSGFRSSFHSQLPVTINDGDNLHLNEKLNSHHGNVPLRRIMTNCDQPGWNQVDENISSEENDEEISHLVGHKNYESPQENHAIHQKNFATHHENHATCQQIDATLHRNYEIPHENYGTYQQIFETRQQNQAPKQNHATLQKNHATLQQNHGTLQKNHGTPQQHYATHGNQALYQHRYVTRQHNHATRQRDQFACQQNAATPQQYHATLQQNHAAIQQNHAATRQNHTAIQPNHTATQQNLVTVHRSHATANENFATRQQNLAHPQQNCATSQENGAISQKNSAILQENENNFACCAKRNLRHQITLNNKTFKTHSQTNQGDVITENVLSVIKQSQRSLSPLRGRRELGSTVRYLEYGDDDDDMAVEYRLALQMLGHEEMRSYKPAVQIFSSAKYAEKRRCEFEFDGNTVLCRVCGDKASGFHYGVHACEGCKGFFRRSIQQKIQYRPCLKNQMCNIMRVNRNRCQYCRLRKCIAVGMSRDAVRFGRVPKREKAKILEQMQKVNAQHQGTLLNDALGDPTDVSDRIIAAHTQFCDFTNSKFARLFEMAWERPQFVDCPAHMACPLSPAQSEGMNKWDEFSNCFTPAIRNVVNFAKSIPGFSVFSQEDQVTLLKAGTFEVLLVHLACLFDSQTNTMMFTNGKLYRKLPQQGNTSAGFLLDSMFDFADRLNKLCLTDQEVALFSGLVVTAPDRPGLRYHDQIQRVHSVISHSLQKLMKANHPEEPATFSKLLMKIPDLRTLNSLHSEKLLGLTVPPNGTSSPGPEDDQMRPDNVTTAGDVPVQPKSEHCPIRSKSPPYNDMSSRSSGYPMMPYQMPIRCPMSTTETPSGLPNQLLANQRPPMRPIVPHQVSVDPKDKELILQTPFGSFHRQSLYYAQFDPAMMAMMNMEAEISAGSRKLENPLNCVSPMTMTKATEVSEKNLSSMNTGGSSPAVNHQAKTAPCSSPDDFIDVDIQPTKSANQKTDLRHMLGKEILMNKLDVRRMMLDPAMPEVFRKRLLDSMDPSVPEGCRKRLLESIECEIDPKIAKLWDYDMRSSRSNSLSSSSSLESTDSAYRTISNPGTPRTHYEMVRSPYTNPADICTRMTTHTVTTPSTLTRVSEEKEERSLATSDKESSSDTPTPDATLPTLRKMLLAAQSHEAAQSPDVEGADDKDTDTSKTDDKADGSQCSSPSADEHYFIHKKLKMKQSLSDRSKYDGEFRSRAASFSTVVGKMRPHMAPPFIKPRSVEAPPRLTTMSPPKSVVLSDRAEGISKGAAPKQSISLPNKNTRLADVPPSATFAAIVSRVMEAALTQEEEENKMKDNLKETTQEESKSPDRHEADKVSPLPGTPQGASRQLEFTSGRAEMNSTGSSDISPIKNNPTGCTPSHGSPPLPNRFAMTKPSERHPELLSRLTAGPKVNTLRSCPRTSPPGGWERTEFSERSRTPPPRLYPIQDSVRSSGSFMEHSPPSLLPVSQSKSSSGVCSGSPDASSCHLTAISSLKDKILKRIDSQENLRLSPQQHASWPGPLARPEQHLARPEQHLACPNQHAARPEHNTARPEHNPARPEHNPARPEQHPTRPDHLARPEQHLTSPEQHSVRSEQHNAHPAQHLARPEQHLARSDQHIAQRPVRSDGLRSDESSRITAHSSARSTPDAASRMRSLNGYHNSPKSSPSGNSNSPAAQHTMSQYPPPNGTMPMSLPPNSVGFFPGAGRLQPSMHPALLYNSAMHYQALQQLHAQAAQIQHQMAHISNMAAMNTMGHNTSGSLEHTGNKADQRNDGHHGDGRSAAVPSHSQLSTNQSRDSEPINLTKVPSGLRPTSIKPEPL